MRKRYIDPDFWISASIGALKPHVRLFFLGLLCCADRDGRLRDSPAKLRAAIFPYDRFDANAALELLQERGMVRRYMVDGQGYIEICNFQVYQRVHHKEVPSWLPPSPQFQALTNQARANHDLSIHQERLMEPIHDSNTTQPPYAGNGNGNGIGVPSEHDVPSEHLERGGRKRVNNREARPASVEEVREYMRSRGKMDPSEAETFWDFYASKGWKVGNQAMKDWRACVRTWEKRATAPAGRARSAYIGSRHEKPPKLDF